MMSKAFKGLKGIVICIIILSLAAGCGQKKHIDLEISDTNFSDYYRDSPDYEELSDLVIQYYNAVIKQYNKSDEKKLGSFETTAEIENLYNEISSISQISFASSERDLDQKIVTNALAREPMTTQFLIAELELLAAANGEDYKNEESFEKIKDSIYKAVENYASDSPTS